MTTKIIAITVSTNYVDKLKLIIKNKDLFHKWYIITSKDDTDTINYITNLDCNNIELLFFDFNSNNSIFNFGGARRHGQLQCNDDDIVLFLDSDIILPNNFLQIINTINFENNVLYGIRHRYDYHSKESFKNNTPDQIHDMSIHKFIFGFFQLYKHNSNLLYNNSNTASVTDLEFNHKFRKKILITDIICKHIGIYNYKIL